MIGTIDVLGYLWQILSALLNPIVGFVLGFLPNGDPQIYSIIDGVGSVGADMTFNVFYFVDFMAVGACLGVLVTVIIVVNVMKLVMRGIDIAHKAVESVPVVE